MKFYGISNFSLQRILNLREQRNSRGRIKVERKLEM